MSTYSLIQCILRGTFGLWSGRTGRIPSEGLDERLRRSGPGAIWKYRDQLAKSGRTKELFETFETQLRETGYAMTGSPIVDSKMVEVPSQAQHP